MATGAAPDSADRPPAGYLVLYNAWIACRPSLPPGRQNRLFSPHFFRTCWLTAIFAWFGGRLIRREAWAPGSWPLGISLASLARHSQYAAPPVEGGSLALVTEYEPGKRCLAQRLPGKRRLLVRRHCSSLSFDLIPAGRPSGTRTCPPLSDSKKCVSSDRWRWITIPANG
jgi:hypothetical protein